jgi:hypothetical protein
MAELRYPHTHHADDPFVEVFRFSDGSGAFLGSIYETINTTNLVFDRQLTDVILSSNPPAKEFIQSPIKTNIPPCFFFVCTKR